MGRRALVVVGMVAVLGAAGHGVAWAHVGLRATEPMAGATLGAAPTAVRLTFSEAPAAPLSTIRVADVNGASYELGRPEPANGDPRSLAVRLRPLVRGVYTVTWRIVSGIDGHATSGVFVFGVEVVPTGTATAAVRAAASRVSPLEVVGRWLFVAGLVVLLGTAAAGAADFGVAPGGGLLGAGGWTGAAGGLLVLATAQRHAAGVPFADLSGTSAGRALVWRGLTLVAAGAALLVARRNTCRPRRRRLAMAAAGVAVLAAAGVHVAAGHAAAGASFRLVAVVAQWAHVAAAGVWLGGLATLLVATRGVPPAAKAAAARRFSSEALVGLLVVVATGSLRAVQQVSSWSELASTGYGRAIVAKIVLFVGIAAAGALNRWPTVRFRRASGVELSLAGGALAAAALLGALPPPVAARPVVPVGIDVSGTDPATTVRVRLRAVSVQPGPNRFVVRAVDSDTGAPVTADRVSLRFTPLDDPSEASTTLVLAPAPGGTFEASGANLGFDGRWRLGVLLERRTRNPVWVDLDVVTEGPPQFVSVQRTPGRPVLQTVSLTEGGFVRVYTDDGDGPPNAGPAGRPGRNRVHVDLFDRFGEPRPVTDVVITAARGSGPAGPLAVRTVGTGQYVADVDLGRGPAAVSVVARTVADNARLRASVDLP